MQKKGKGERSEDKNNGPAPARTINKRGRYEQTMVKGKKSMWNIMRVKRWVHMKGERGVGEVARAGMVKEENNRCLYGSA